MRTEKPLPEIRLQKLPTVEGELPKYVASVVFENGNYAASQADTPQGAIASLAVFWAHEEGAGKC